MSPLTKMLTEVSVCIEEIERDNTQLRHDVKKIQYQNGDLLDELHVLRQQVIQYQNGDLLDELHVLRQQVQERDIMIAELRAMLSRAGEDAAK